MIPSSFRWQERHMPLFLESYRQHECLWNTQCSDYKKSTAREKAYRSMLADLSIPGLTVADIRAKIKTIRTRYGAELTKIRNSESTGAEDVYEPRLFWFKDADAFLRSVCSSKLGFSSLKDLDSSGKDTSRGKATNAGQHCDDEPSDQQTTDVEDNEATSLETTENSSAATTTKIGTKLQNCKNKVRKRALYASVPAIHESAKKPKHVPDDSGQYPNEFDVFCESLAIQLKKMPLNRALVCQEKLQGVMTQERLYQLTQSHHRSSSSAYRQSLDTSNSEKYSVTPSPDPSIQSESD